VTGATIPEGSVVITPTEMYKEMLATHQAVRDVSGKLDGALEAHARRLDDHDKDLSDHEARLRHVEQVGATTADIAELEHQHAPRIKVLEDAVAPIADHKTRVPALEKRVWMAAGAVGLLAAGASAAATLLAGAGR
jgi:hypothetical protein